MVVPSHCSPWVLLGGSDCSCGSPGCLRVLGLLVVGAGQGCEGPGGCTACSEQGEAGTTCLEPPLSRTLCSQRGVSLSGEDRDGVEGVVPVVVGGWGLLVSAPVPAGLGCAAKQLLVPLGNGVGSVWLCLFGSPACPNHTVLVQ